MYQIKESNFYLICWSDKGLMGIIGNRHAPLRMDIT